MTTLEETHMLKAIAQHKAQDPEKHKAQSEGAGNLALAESFHEAIERTAWEYVAELDIEDFERQVELADAYIDSFCTAFLRF